MGRLLSLVLETKGYGEDEPAWRSVCPAFVVGVSRGDARVRSRTGTGLENLADLRNFPGEMAVCGRSGGARAQSG